MAKVFNQCKITRNVYYLSLITGRKLSNEVIRNCLLCKQWEYVVKSVHAVTQCNTAQLGSAAKINYKIN